MKNGAGRDGQSSGGIRSEISIPPRLRSQPPPTPTSVDDRTSFDTVDTLERWCRREGHQGDAREKQLPVQDYLLTCMIDV